MIYYFNQPVSNKIDITEGKYIIFTGNNSEVLVEKRIKGVKAKSMTPATVMNVNRKPYRGLFLLPPPTLYKENYRILPQVLVIKTCTRKK